MGKEWDNYLFQYQHEGASWTVEIPARSEADAMERLLKLPSAKYLGVTQMKLPVELGIFARLICWWQNRRARA
jgi:hypothetical protein